MTGTVETIAAARRSNSDQDFFRELDETVEAGWADIHAGRFWTHLRTHGLDRDLYQRLMIELFHYTAHNSINQAFAAWKVPHENTMLLKFCYEHAAEELGHEKMVLHDLRAVDLLPADMNERGPLPPTRALIAYLYFVGLTQGAVARLGYSYWAETAYDYLDDVLAAIRDLGITDHQLTFFVSHQKVDVAHAAEVREMVGQFAVTPEERRSVKTVAQTTLYLTGKLLEAAFDAYLADRKTGE